MTEESRKKAMLIGQTISTKKGQDLVILDVEKMNSFTDYFVIVSGRSIRQVQAIASQIEKTLRAKGIRPMGRKALVRILGF